MRKDPIEVLLEEEPRAVASQAKVVVERVDAIAQLLHMQQNMIEHLSASVEGRLRGLDEKLDKGMGMLSAQVTSTENSVQNFWSQMLQDQPPGIEMLQNRVEVLLQHAERHETFLGSAMEKVAAIQHYLTRKKVNKAREATADFVERLIRGH